MSEVEVIRQLEYSELNNPVPFMSSPGHYGQLILAYLAAGDYSGADEVCRRIPDSLKSTVPLNTIICLTRAAVNGQFSGFFNLAQMFYSAVNKDSTDTYFLQRFEKIVGNMRKRTASIICKGYCVISFASLSDHLGLSIPDAVAYIKQNAGNVALTFDDSSRFVHFSPLKDDSHISRSVPNASVPCELSSLTDYVTFSEIH